MPNRARPRFSPDLTGLAPLFPGSGRFSGLNRPFAGKTLGIAKAPPLERIVDPAAESRLVVPHVAPTPTAADEAEVLKILLPKLLPPEDIAANAQYLRTWVGKENYYEAFKRCQPNV